MKTANERKAAERSRRRAAGLVPVEVWVPARGVPLIKARAANMSEELRVLDLQLQSYAMPRIALHALKIIRSTIDEDHGKT